VTSEVGSVEVEATKSQAGAATKPYVGRVWYTVAVRQKWQGQVVAYNGSTAPVLTGMARAMPLGGSASLSAEVDALTMTDANTVSSTVNGKLGCLLASKDGDTVTPLGFVESISGGGPYVHTLCEDAPIDTGTDLDRGATASFWHVADEAPLWAIRVVGADASQDHRYLGAAYQRTDFSWDEDGCKWATHTFRVYGGKKRGTGGGLRSVTAYMSMESVYQRPGARIMLGSNQIAAQDDGTADPGGTCGVRDLTASIEWPHFVARSPANTHAPEGVCAVALRSPIVTASCQIPMVPDWDSGGESIVETIYRNRGDLSLSWSQGDALGRVVAGRIARGHITAWPDPVAVDGVYHQPVQLRAGENLADGAATDAGRKPFVLAIG
jgi:hypothetical protein